MAKIRIDLPARFIFRTELAVYASHINYGNHMDNAAMIQLVSEARMRFFASLGFSEDDVDGPGIIVADLAIQYRAEVFHGDVLIFDLTVTDPGRVGCDIVFQVTDQAKGHEVARGKNGIVFFNYTTRKPVEIPHAFAAKVFFN